MSLTSLSFFCFFAITFGLYWLVRSNWAQKWLIIVASYVFYASFDYRFCLLLLATSLVGYVSGRSLEQTARALGRKLILAAGLLVNLGVLAVFKYLGFFAEGAAHLLELLGLDLDPITLEVVLPVGISFYLFKIVSYLIDVYRGNIKAANNPTDVLLYAAFFPQLLSGPIERAGSFFPALLRKRTFEYPMAIDGARQMLWGLFKKLALADGLAVVVSSIMDDWTNAQGPELALGTVLFSFQIYCDFSGYTDISIGLSKLLGFKSMRNFAYPYFSQNVAEFWRR